MPTDLLTQLEAFGRLLDQTVQPVTIDDLAHTTTPANTLLSSGAEVLELRPQDVAKPDRRWSPRLVGIAAATLLIGGTAAALVAHLSDSRTSGHTATTPGSNASVDQSIPIPLVPAGSTLRFSSPLDDSGTIDVYDTADHSRICEVIRADGGTWGGCYDMTTFDTGQAWSYVGQGAISQIPRRLVGITPTNIGFHAIVAGKTLTPDRNGLWYTTFPAGTPNFTITTNKGTSQYPLDQPAASASTIAIAGSTP